VVVREGDSWSDSQLGGAVLFGRASECSTARSSQNTNRTNRKESAWFGNVLERRVISSQGHGEMSRTRREVGQTLRKPLPSGPNSEAAATGPRRRTGDSLHSGREATGACKVGQQPATSVLTNQTCPPQKVQGYSAPACAPRWRLPGATPQPKMGGKYTNRQLVL
jgi:hypothetical protein